MTTNSGEPTKTTNSGEPTDNYGNVINDVIPRLTIVAENLTLLATNFAKLTLEVSILAQTVQNLTEQSDRSSTILVDTADGLTEVVRSTAEILRLMSLRKNREE